MKLCANSSNLLQIPQRDNIIVEEIESDKESFYHDGEISNEKNNNYSDQDSSFFN